MIKCIIFDFDGVIAESNSVKTDTFVKLFEGHPRGIIDAIRKFHLQNGGMSRFDKFRYIYANILKEPLPEEKYNALCSDFNKYVVDGVINAPMVEGVEEFLINNKGRYDMYIVSGTPQSEIVEIIKKRKLDKYFSAAYGSPRSKKELIENILKERKYKREEAVFVGDSINDYEGAKAAGIAFVAKLADDAEVELFPGVVLETKIRTISEFEDYLKSKR